jgi:TPR repeat protein
MNRVDRLYYYEPFFHEWKINKILKEYDDVVFVELIHETSPLKSVLKMKTIMGDEASIDVQVHDLLMNYEMNQLNALENTPYLNEEHFYIEEDNQTIGLDICFLCKGEWKEENAPYSLEGIDSLAFQYLNGDTRVHDEYKAFELLSIAATSLNDPKCQCTLGFCYEMGYGVKKDLSQAIYWYMEAANLGDEVAQCNLAYCYYQGIGTDVSIDDALYWFEESAKRGYARAIFQLGEYYCFVERNDELAYHYYVEAAHKGYANAYYSIGFCYEQGIYVEIDYEEAAKWYLKAAKLDIPQAQLQLGYLYEAGEGVEKNYETSVYWYKKACDLNYAPSYCYLGYCYEVGQGVENVLMLCI